MSYRRLYIAQYSGLFVNTFRANPNAARFIITCGYYFDVFLQKKKKSLVIMSPKTETLKKTGT